MVGMMEAIERNDAHAGQQSLPVPRYPLFPTPSPSPPHPTHTHTWAHLSPSALIIPAIHRMTTDVSID